MFNPSVTFSWDFLEREKNCFRPRLFVGKWFPFGKWIPGKVNSGKVNSGKVNSDVWQCYGKWTGKHFPVFVCVMENELENNLLIIFFSSLLK